MLIQRKHRDGCLFGDARFGDCWGALLEGAPRKCASPITDLRTKKVGVREQDMPVGNSCPVAMWDMAAGRVCATLGEWTRFSLGDPRAAAARGLPARSLIDVYDAKGTPGVPSYH